MGRLVSIADIGSTTERSAGGSSNISTSLFRTAPSSFPTSRVAGSGHDGGYNNMVNGNGLASQSITSSRDTDDSENHSIPTTISTITVSRLSTGSTATASRTTTSSGRRGGQVSIADLGGATNKGGGIMMTGAGGSDTTTTTSFQKIATDSSGAASVAGTAAPNRDSPLYLGRHHRHHHETSSSTSGPNVADDHSPHVHQCDHPAGPMDMSHLGRGNAPMQFAEQDVCLRVLTEEEGEEEECEEMIIPLPYCYSRERVPSFVLNGQTTAFGGDNEGGDESMSDNEVSVSSLVAIAEAEEKVHLSPLFGVGSRNLAAAAASSSPGGARTIQEPDQGFLHSLASPRSNAAGALTYGYPEKEHSPFPSHPPAAAAAAVPLVDSEKKGTVVRLTDLGKTAASHRVPVEAVTCESNAAATPTPTKIELVESVKVIATLESHTTTQMKHPLALAPPIAPNEVVAILERIESPPPLPPHHVTRTIVNGNDSKNYFNSDCGNDRSVQEATVVGELFESSALWQQQQQQEEEEQLLRSSSSLSSGLNSDTLAEKVDEEFGIPMSVVFTPSHSKNHAPNPIMQSIGNRLGRWGSGVSRGSPRMGIKKMLNLNATSTTSIPTTSTLASNIDSELQLRQSREMEPDSGHDRGPGRTRTTTTNMGVGQMEQLPTSAVDHVEVSGTSGETLTNREKSGEAIVESKPVWWVNARSVVFALVCTIVVMGLAVLLWFVL